MQNVEGACTKAVRKTSPGGDLERAQSKGSASPHRGEEEEGSFGGGRQA